MSGFTGHVQIFSVSYSIFSHFFMIYILRKNMNDIHFMVYPNVTSWYTSMVYPHFFMIVLGYTMLVPDPWRRKDRCSRKSYKTRRSKRKPTWWGPLWEVPNPAQPGYIIQNHPLDFRMFFGCSMIYLPEMVNVNKKLWKISTFNG